jgi:hypothetical protein
MRERERERERKGGPEGLEMATLKESTASRFVARMLKEV